MGILESLMKKKEDAREAKRPNPVPPEAGKSLQEILADRNGSDMFGKLLESEGLHELGRRVIEAKLEPDDLRILAEKRVQYLEKIKNAEAVEKLLTEETLVAVARNHEEFQRIVDLLGTEKALKAIKNQLKEVALTDETRFSSIADPLKALEKYQKGSWKKDNEAIEKLCEENKINPADFVDAINITDPAEREKALKKLAIEKAGAFKKVISLGFYKGKFSNELLDKLKMGGFVMEAALGQLDNHKRQIGDALFVSANDNAAIRNAFARELIGEKNAPKIEEKMGMAQARLASEQGFSEQDTLKRWEELKKQRKFSALDATRQAMLKNEFMDGENARYEKQTQAEHGFWYKLFAAMFSKKIESRRNLLK